MKAIVKGLCSLITLCLFSCNTAEKREEVHQKEVHDNWSYNGETSPEHWAELEKNSDCSGKRQSPINIIDINTVEKEEPIRALDFYYSPSTTLCKVRNNGHSIQFDFDPGDSIVYHDTNFNLVQIHFHEPSEHTLNGVRYPIEFHLVHQSNEKNYAVLGIFGIEGVKSETMERMGSFLPLKKGEEKEFHKAFDLSHIFPENKSYYSYGGSLTTPPCSENVQWIVFKEPHVVSHENVLKLKANMPLENYRDEQPLNDRIVYLHSK
ncbi:carbonic anhydrase family protein [Lutimonas halocynthiae]|uniref:carbonic anhydrase n=1 Tax=Lutimonas halocynthiae TaxID=1446477 RepID=UPI0025B527C5|nr:carbonic anhydrase family protein [Lutimonas halocynthiae]MDN3642048.1 carbonic anhydrase family protein [Lutimonas halocynthiae]